MASKYPVQTIKTAEAVATILAAIDHQVDVVKHIDESCDAKSFKPSSGFNVKNGDEQQFSIPSVVDYAKRTFVEYNSWEINLKYIHNDAVPVTVTDEHRTEAEELISIIQNKNMMMVLKGQKINGFIGNIFKLIELEEVTQRDIGLLSYVPKTARQFKEQDLVLEKKSRYMDSQQIGKVGDKVFLEVTLFNTRYISAYDCELFEGVDAAGNLITFFKNGGGKLPDFELNKVYSINARVKKVEANDYSYGAIVNTINYVRLNK